MARVVVVFAVFLQVVEPLGVLPRCAAAEAGLELEGRVARRAEADGPADCCALCAAVRGAAAYVWCREPAACGTECWCKEAPLGTRARGEDVPWASAALPAPKAASTPLRPYRPDARVALGTALGDVVIELHADAPRSASFVRDLAAAGACGSGCVWYRAERTPPGWGRDGFYGPPYALVQGGLRPAAGALDPPGQPVERREEVRRGDVAWAGGAMGPDFFVATADHPEWGASHCVFGRVADARSLAVVDALSELPTRPAKGVVTTQQLVQQVDIYPKLVAS